MNFTQKEIYKICCDREATMMQALTKVAEALAKVKNDRFAMTPLREAVKKFNEASQAVWDAAPHSTSFVDKYFGYTPIRIQLEKEKV